MRSSLYFAASCSSIRFVNGVDDSPIANRGCFPRSSMITENPSRLSTIAINDPEKPEPAIAKSYSAFKSFLRTFHSENSKGSADANSGSVIWNGVHQNNPNKLRIAVSPIDPRTPCRDLLKFHIPPLSVTLLISAAKRDHV